MNRRNLMKQCGQMLLGMGAAVAGVKAAEDDKSLIVIERSRPATAEELHVFFHSEPSRGFNDAVVRAVVNDYKNNSRMREIIERTTWGTD